MTLWQIISIIGIAFLILEMFVPMMFFLNFAIASFFVAALSLFTANFNILVPAFVVLSLMLLAFLRPLLMNKKLNSQKTGVEEKYIGKTAKVTENIDENNGAVSIYGERWNARSLNGEKIFVGDTVKIVKNESLIFYVEKI